MKNWSSGPSKAMYMLALGACRRPARPACTPPRRPRNISAAAQRLARVCLFWPCTHRIVVFTCKSSAIQQRLQMSWIRFAADWMVSILSEASADRLTTVR